MSRMPKIAIARFWFLRKYLIMGGGGAGSAPPDAMLRRTGRDARVRFVCGSRGQGSEAGSVAARGRLGQAVDGLLRGGSGGGVLVLAGDLAVHLDRGIGVLQVRLEDLGDL